MTSKYTIQVETSDEGECFLPFPPELLAQLGWVEGTVLLWTDNTDGTFTLTKKESNDE